MQVEKTHFENLCYKEIWSIGIYKIYHLRDVFVLPSTSKKAELSILLTCSDSSQEKGLVSPIPTNVWVSLLVILIKMRSGIVQIRICPG